MYRYKRIKQLETAMMRAYERLEFASGHNPEPAQEGISAAKSHLLAAYHCGVVKVDK